MNINIIPSFIIYWMSKKILDNCEGNSYNCSIVESRWRCSRTPSLAQTLS